MQIGLLSGGFVAQTDIIVIGAGIVGTCCAVHLAKRGLSVALVDRGAVGEGTSYGNTGIITGETLFPPAFPADWRSLLRIALKRSPQVNYLLGFLPRAAPWLAAFVAASRPSRLIETAEAMRPLFARAVAEHEALAAEAGAERYLNHRGWLKLYRTDAAFAAQAGELELAANFGIAPVTLDRDRALALEPALAGVFDRAAHWSGAVSVSNPLELTRAYAARFAVLGGSRRRRRAHARRANGTGGLRPRRGRSTPAKPCSRSAPGRATCSILSACGSRSPSSAAITAISARRETPCSAARCSTPRTAIASRPWSRGSASRPALNSPTATRRLRPSSCACAAGGAAPFPLGEPAEARPGSGTAVLFDPGRSLGAHPAARSVARLATRIGA
jgi:hypothetical protein